MAVRTTRRGWNRFRNVSEGETFERPLFTVVLLRFVHTEDLWHVMAGDELFDAATAGDLPVFREEDDVCGGHAFQGICQTADRQMAFT